MTLASFQKVAEAGKVIGDFDDFLALLKEYLEEDALEYIRGALDGDVEDPAQQKKIAKIFEEGKGKIGRKLSKAEAGMEVFWGEGGEAGALTAIERWGNGEHIYVYDNEGKLIYDLNFQRVKGFDLNIAPSGEEYFKQYKLKGEVPNCIMQILGW